MNLILSGLTGAGKSSLSRSVAERLGREWVSGSAIRRRLVTGGPARVRQSPAEREFWLRSPEAIAADRDRMRDARIDRSLDRELARTHDQRCDVVFDAWFMAWHVRRPSLRVWLDSPLEVRADRVASDLGADGAARNLTEEVMAKDERSRAFGRLAYSFDIFTDRAPFTVILANGRGLPYKGAVNILCAILVAAERRPSCDLPDETITAAKTTLVRCPRRLAAAIGVEQEG